MLPHLSGTHHRLSSLTSRCDDSKTDACSVSVFTEQRHYVFIEQRRYVQIFGNVVECLFI